MQQEISLFYINLIFKRIKGDNMENISLTEIYYLISMSFFITYIVLSIATIYKLNKILELTNESSRIHKGTQKKVNRYKDLFTFYSLFVASIIPILNMFVLYDYTKEFIHTIQLKKAIVYFN